MRIDLSDDELYARLLQAGLCSSDATWLVDHREQAEDEIEEALG